MGSLGLGLWAVPAAAQAEKTPVETNAPPSILLVTLDTTRADALGCYGGEGADTPTLDALAAMGLRYQRALAPAPVTAPSHASILTGRRPPEHGVRDNGIAVLPQGVPTLAEALAAAGYETAAFVASRVLDRRFGLDRGFATYDDRMAAERVGEYGYPERDAVAVTTAATGWLVARGSASSEASSQAAADEPTSPPFFLWVHFYDPHAPYEAPALFQRPGQGAGPRGAYLAEVSYVDDQLEGLLAAARQSLAPGAELLVAVAGDHGESLEEHNEAGHGLFLYESVLRVPLILAGPGIPDGAKAAESSGAVEPRTVALRRLAPTIAALAGLDPEPFGTPLPGIPSLRGPADEEAEEVEEPPVYSEARLPRTAFGWAPLAAVSGPRYRLIEAPRPELYDLLEDPGETVNLLAPPSDGEEASESLGEEARAAAGRLKRVLDTLRLGFQELAPEPAPVDGELRAALESLGYLAGAAPRGDDEGGPGPGDAIDPKDGIELLRDFDRANQLAARGEVAAALEILERLVETSPNNVPFLSRLGTARLEAGDSEGAVTALRSAVELNPRLSFLHLRLADAYRALGRRDDAEAEFRAALALDPRAPGAWLALAQGASQRGDKAGEKKLLEEAVEVGTASAFILTRLAQIESDAGNREVALGYLDEAAELLPQWPTVFYVRGVILQELGRLDKARSDFQRTTVLAPTTREGRDARRRLGEL